MKPSHKLTFLSLVMILAIPTIYANDVENSIDVEQLSEEAEVETPSVGGKSNNDQIQVNPKIDSGKLDVGDHPGNSNSLTKKRFIPVELFTGAKWDGKHELSLKEVSNISCSSFSGRPCDNYYITGPFKTKENKTKIEWAGNEISYYRRTFSTRRMGKVESFFTINNSKDGLVRIYDKRKQWGARTYDGLGSKFPLGYWKQGEVRTYDSRRPTRIEIIELDGPNHCLTFRWVIGNGERKNMDNNYTFCPERGFTKINHNNAGVDSKK